MTKEEPFGPPNTRRPIMALLDLLGRRWALRIIWELRGGEPLSSRALRVACDDLSPSVLQARVDELRNAGIVALEAGAGYALTPEGQRLAVTLGELNGWAKDWVADRDRHR